MLNVNNPLSSLKIVSLHFYNSTICFYWQRRILPYNVNLKMYPFNFKKCIHFFIEFSAFMKRNDHEGTVFKFE